MKTDTKPTDIILHNHSHTLEVVFSKSEKFNLPWEYLRVFSPSSEVRARRGKDRILVTGKKDVRIDNLKPIGNYALKIYFDDGHNSGLFDWSYLRELGVNQAENWKNHLKRVKDLE